MIKKIWLGIVCSALLVANLAYAQEVLPDFGPNNTSRANEELRKLNKDASTVKADVATLTATVSAAMPAGIIVMWSGTVASLAALAPTWYLCDGNNGTPDLRNKFIVCADADDGGVANTTLTGVGVHTQSGGSIAHDHTGSVPAGGAHEHHLAANNYTAPAAGGTAMAVGASTIGSDTHSHVSITVNSKDAPQPYYALCLIKKVI